MKKLLMAAASLTLLSLSPAFAADLTDMVGTWEWEGFTIDIEECDDTICATVTDGPNNVGESMFLTAPEASDSGWTAEVMHPATGETYYSKFTIDGDTWTMEGCTESGVCAQGDFTRA